MHQGTCSRPGLRLWLVVVAAAALALVGLAAPAGSAAAGRVHPKGVPPPAPPFAAYVANNNSTTVAVVYTSDNQVHGTITVGNHPARLAVAPDGKHAYVTTPGDFVTGHVVVIDTATNTVTHHIPVGSGPAGLAVTPDGARVYVATRDSDDVSVISTAKNAVVDTIPVDSFPTGVAVTPDGSHVYVTNQGSASVSVIPTASDTVVDTIPVGGFPAGIAITPDGGHAYVANGGAHSVSVIDTATNAVVDTIPVGFTPQGVAVAPDGGHVYVADYNSDSVSVIATASDTVVDTIPVGTSPADVAVTRDSGHVYVSNSREDTVSVIAAATDTVVATITGFAGPYGIAMGLPAGDIPAAGVVPGAYASFGARYVVYTGAHGGVWQKQVGTPGPATSLGGHLVSGPAPVNAGGTRIVFGEGTNHALFEKVAGGPWRPLGGRLTSKPGAAAENADSYRVYVRGAGDGNTWERVHTTTGWGPWHLFGGRLLAHTGPAAAFRGGTFFVLVAGTNRALFLAHDGGAGFAPVGGETTASPGLLSSRSSGSLVGFAQGTNRDGRYHRFAPLFTGWPSMAGVLSSGLSGAATATHWYAYALGSGGPVWEHTGTTGSTGVWTRVTP